MAAALRVTLTIEERRTLKELRIASSVPYQESMTKPYAAAQRFRLERSSYRRDNRVSRAHTL